MNNTEQTQSNVYFKYYVNSIIDKVNAINAQIEQMRKYLADYEPKPDGVVDEKITAILKLQKSSEWEKFLQLYKQE